MGLDIASLMFEVDSTQVQRAKKDLEDLEGVSGSVERAVSALGDAFRRVMAYGTVHNFLDFGSSIKDTALLAARYEALGVAMNQIGATAGYSVTDLARYQSALENTGISALQSRNSITKLIAANVDLDKATRLARVALDLAVVSNMGPSEAFAKMIQGIQTGQVRLLHNMGIMVTFQDEYKKMAKELGKNTAELTDYERVQARTNAALEYGERVAKAYEASMGTAGTQLKMMGRYTEDLRVSIGQLFGPALTQIVSSLTDMFQALAQSIAKARVTGEFAKWQGVFLSVANAAIFVVKTVIDLRNAIIALIAGWMAMKTSVFVIGLWTSLQKSIAEAQVVLNAYAIATGTVAETATVGTVAVAAFQKVVMATGGPVVWIIGAITAVVAAFILFKDSTDETNRVLGESISKAASASDSWLKMSQDLKSAVDAQAKLSDGTKDAKKAQEDLEMAKLRILALGPQYDTALIKEATNVKALADAYNLLTHQQLQEKIETAKTLVKDLEDQMKNLSPSFFSTWLDSFLGGTGTVNDISVSAKKEELSDKLAEARGNLVKLMEAMKALDDFNKGKHLTPTDDDDTKKKLEQARSLEDAWDAVNRARLQGDKAVTDEEKLQHAIALAQLDTHQKIRDLKRSFSDGKIAGGSSELKKLIAAWKEVEDIQTKSAQRAYDESQARKQDEALKQITDDYKKLADITQELDILDDKGYNHQFVQVEQKFNSFRDTVSKVYEDLIQDATAASISQGLMFSPEVIKLMGDYAAMLKRIEDARKDAMAKVTASIVESDASKLRQALKEAQTKDGYTYTFDQQAMAVEALNRELRLTPDALKKVKSEIEAAQKRSGDWLGGLKAGFIDFYNSATNVYEKIRKASNKWLEDFSNKLAQMVVTGKANFKELAQSIIQDLIAIYIESLLVQVVWKSMKWIDSLSTLGSGTGSSAGASSSTGSYAASHPLSIGPAGSALGAMASPINAPSARGGDVSISVSVDARGNTDTAVSGAGVGTRSAAMLGQMIADSVRQVIVEEKRPRGLLESLA